jgi:hypothetical protein
MQDLNVTGKGFRGGRAISTTGVSHGAIFTDYIVDVQSNPAMQQPKVKELQATALPA